MVSSVFSSDFSFKIALFVYLPHTVSTFKHPHMFQYLQNDIIVCKWNRNKAYEWKKNQSYFITTSSREERVIFSRQTENFIVKYESDDRIKHQTFQLFIMNSSCKAEQNWTAHLLYESQFVLIVNSCFEFSLNFDRFKLNRPRDNSQALLIISDLILLLMQHSQIINHVALWTENSTTK